MDAFELLKQDHQKVSGIFEQIEQGKGSREQLFAQVKQELDIHALVEETILYPALKEYEETRDLIPEAYEEHQEVKDLLAELQSTPTNDENWDSLFQELKDGVEHHVEEEEGEMFVKAREALSQQQIDDIGQRIQQAKQQQKGMSAG